MRRWLAGATVLLIGLVPACAPVSTVTDGLLVHRPASAGPGAPLVVVLHGLGGSGAGARAGSGWDAVADREGFVVAYPDGVGASWNAGGCCGEAHAAAVDDVARLDALAAGLGATSGTDPRRTYAVGFSNGAMMAYAWACDRPTLAGIGVVGGARVTPCPDPHPLAVVAVHGDADRSVPLGGGVGPRSATGYDYPSFAELLAPFPGADAIVLPGVGHEWPPGAAERIWAELTG